MKITFCKSLLKTTFAAPSDYRLAGISGISAVVWVYLHMVAIQLIAGLVLLVAGAEVLVKGASRIAGALGISPLVIGLTVVAFGTSAPEMAVSVMSATQGNPDIALGNVVGSNICNVLLILGIASIIIPLVVQQQLIRLDVPVMIGVSLLVLLLGFDGRIAVWEGILFVLLGIAYTIFLIRMSRKETSKSVVQEYEQEFGNEKKQRTLPLWLSVVFVLAGLVLLVLGSRWMVNAAVAIARVFEISDLVIGLTIIAIGTSLPEIATSVIAGLRGERDIAVGNVVGSCIFNIVFILGITAIAGGGIGVPVTALRFDIPVMIIVAVACLPIFFTGNRLDRWEGIFFLFYYFAYTAYLILASIQHASLVVFERAMLWFTIPLTLLTLVIITLRTMRNTHR